jgi:hypothetical protein
MGNTKILKAGCRLDRGDLVYETKGEVFRAGFYPRTSNPLSLEEFKSCMDRVKESSERKRAELWGGVLYELKYLEEMNTCN